MKAIGIVRKLDELGRVVVPMEIRRVHGWEAGTPLEVFATEDGISLRAYKSDVDKEKTLEYLRSQLEDVTNEDDRQALITAISYVSK